MEVAAQVVATLATSLIGLLAALAYWRDRGFPMMEAIRLARETRLWMQLTDVTNSKGVTGPVWVFFPLTLDLDDLADRKLRGFRGRRK